MATPIGPPELKIAMRCPRFPFPESCCKPLWTRMQKSGHGSISGMGSSPAAQRPITTSKSLETFSLSFCVLKCLVQFADACISFQQSRQGTLHHGFGLKLVKREQNFRLRPAEPGIRVNLPHDSCRIALPRPRARVNPVERDLVFRPVHAEKLGLRFAFGGELVVVCFQE